MSRYKVPLNEQLRASRAAAADTAPSAHSENRIEWELKRRRTGYTGHSALPD